MKRGGEDCILFKRLCVRFPRIVASFVFSDGNAIKPAAEIYAPMEETLFQPPKVSGLSAGSDDQLDHYSTGLGMGMSLRDDHDGSKFKVGDHVIGTPRPGTSAARF